MSVHGWVYQFETGKVFDYNPQEGQFIAIEGSDFTTSSTTLELPPI